MNILQIANKAINPPDGGTLAILSLAKGYVENGHRVHLLNMVTHKHINKDHFIDDKYRNSLTIEGIKVNTKVSIIKALINLILSDKPYIAQRFISRQFKQKIHHLLQNQKFDFIQFEGLYALQYISSIQNVNTKIIYRPHNLEFLIWERNAVKSKNRFKKWYFKILSERLRKLEKSLLNTYDFIFPISTNDAVFFKQLGNKKPVWVVPFGIDINKINEYAHLSKGAKQINYIGALDWIPNQEGLLWFIDKCLDKIAQSIPDITLNIAGRNAPDWLTQKFNHPNINYIGEVGNAYEFMQTSGPIIVPLFSGSGMRVKIIEAMALKKAVIATKIAAEGIECTHEENILIHTKETFASEVIHLLENENLQTKIGENAYHFVTDHYDFIKIASEALNFIK
ncbi:MAG: glycosyltransferase family 4 protein [Bacteroidetes bacterium]|nr:glycosyltransferase family 4 protein [Bacteroidota bacterium]